MRASYHVVASAGISLGVQVSMHSWPATIGCFFSGVLIDVDHYLEYYIFRKKFPFRYKDLVDFCWDNTATKQYLFFHAWEHLFVFWFLICFFGLGKLWIGIAIGLTTHLLLDQVTNPIHPLFYFLTYRARHQFEKTKILSKEYFQRSK